MRLPEDSKLHSTKHSKLGDCMLDIEISLKPGRKYIANFVVEPAYGTE